MSHNQVVVWKPSLFSSFQEPKTFNFGDFEISIQQKIYDSPSVGSVVWDSSPTLSQFLFDSSKEGKISLKDKKVIELGAGTAVVSIVASFLGADVVTTDLKEELEASKVNIELNFKGKNLDKPKVVGLDWSQEIPKEVQEINFDYILCSDVIYGQNTQLFKDLVKTLYSLSSPLTKILIAQRERYERERDFFNLSEFFFNWEILLTNNNNVRIYQLVRKSKSEMWDENEIKNL